MRALLFPRSNSNFCLWPGAKKVMRFPSSLFFSPPPATSALFASSCRINGGKGWNCLSVPAHIHTTQTDTHTFENIYVRKCEKQLEKFYSIAGNRKIGRKKILRFFVYRKEVKYQEINSSTRVNVCVCVCAYTFSEPKKGEKRRPVFRYRV